MTMTAAVLDAEDAEEAGHRRLRRPGGGLGEQVVVEVDVLDFDGDIDLALHNALGLRRPYLLNALTAPPAPSALLRIADLPNARRKIA